MNVRNAYNIQSSVSIQPDMQYLYYSKHIFFWDTQRRTSHAFNTLNPDEAYMCLWIWSSLVQIIVSCLLDAKTLFAPMTIICQLHNDEQASRSIDFQSGKFVWYYRLQNVGHFLQTSLRWGSGPYNGEYCRVSCGIILRMSRGPSNRYFNNRHY